MRLVATSEPPKPPPLTGLVYSRLPHFVGEAKVWAPPFSAFV